MNDYVKYELDELGELNEGKKEQFKIDDISTANWAFRKISALETRADEIEELARNEAQRIEDWKQREMQSITDSIDYFKNLLISYYSEEKAVDDKFKLKTPYGRVSSTKRTSYNYNDDVLLEELDTEFIRVKKEVDKANLKKNIVLLDDGRVATSDGIVLDGLTYENTVNYTVKTDRQV